MQVVRRHPWWTALIVVGLAVALWLVVSIVDGSSSGDTGIGPPTTSSTP